MLPASLTRSPRSARKPLLESVQPPRPTPRSRRRSSARRHPSSDLRSRRRPRCQLQRQYARRGPSGASNRDGSPRTAAPMSPAGRSAAWFMLVGGHVPVVIANRTTPLSIQARTSPREEAIMRARAWTTGPIIRLSMLGHEQRILTGYPVAAPIPATVWATCFFISMGLNDGSLSTRRNRRNVPISLPKFAGCLRYTAITTRYGVTLVPSSIRPASWTRAATLSRSSNTTVTMCR